MRNWRKSRSSRLPGIPRCGLWSRYFRSTRCEAPTRSHVFVFEIWNTEASEPDRIWSRTLGFIQSRLMPRLSYHRYCTSSHDNYTATRTELISTLQLHRATNEESHFSSPCIYLRGKSCAVCHLQFGKPNFTEFYPSSGECARCFNFNPVSYSTNAAILHQRYVKSRDCCELLEYPPEPRSRRRIAFCRKSHFERLRHGFDPSERVKGDNRRASGLFETHSHAQSRDYTDIVTITLTVTLSPRRLSTDVVKERADRERAGEMIVVERGGYLKYALSPVILMI